MPFFRRAIAVVIGLALGSLAFGVGLPWIISDAPPEAETLWAREIQAHAPAVLPAASSAALKRSAASHSHR